MTLVGPEFRFRLINKASVFSLSPGLDQLVTRKLTAHEVRRRDGKLGPVIDVVPVGRPLEEPVQPGLQAVQQLVLEDGQVVWLGGNSM